MPPEAGIRDPLLDRAELGARDGARDGGRDGGRDGAGPELASELARALSNLENNGTQHFNIGTPAQSRA